MAYNANLMKAPFLRGVVGELDDADEAAIRIRDAFADYEAIDELPRAEQAEAREMARDEVYEALGEWLATADKVRALRERIEQAVGG